MDTDGYAITTSGVGAMLSSPVHEGDVIALVPKEGWHNKPCICQRRWRGDNTENLSALFIWRVRPLYLRSDNG